MNISKENITFKNKTGVNYVKKTDKAEAVWTASEKKKRKSQMAAVNALRDVAARDAVSSSG